jgi:hypothetical protein
MEIPEEILCIIISLLSIKDNIRVARVSKLYNRICMDDRVWKKYFNDISFLPKTNILASIKEKYNITWYESIKAKYSKHIHTIIDSIHGYSNYLYFYLNKSKNYEDISSHIVGSPYYPQSRDSFDILLLSKYRSKGINNEHYLFYIGDGTVKEVITLIQTYIPTLRRIYIFIGDTKYLLDFSTDIIDTLTWREQVARWVKGKNICIYNIPKYIIEENIV